MPRLKWFTWVGLVGAGIAGWSLVWLGISSFIIPTVNRIQSISVLSASISPQVLTLLVAVLLAMEATEWLRRH